jgi:hypothetical protein
MSTPNEQRAPWPSESHPLELPAAATTTITLVKQKCTPSAATPHRRQGDRNSGDNGDAAAKRAAKRAVKRALRDEERRRQFPEMVYCRYADLLAWNIVTNYQHLVDLIDNEGFPAGTLLGSNSRGFLLHDVKAWLRARPTARRSTPHRVKASKETATR